MGLIILFLIYSYSFSSALSALLYVSDEGLLLRILTGTIGVLCFWFYAKDIMGRKKLSAFELGIIFISLCLLAGMGVTYTLYGYATSVFKGQLLSMGAKAIPAMLMGVYVAKNDKLDEVLKWHQPLILFFTITIVVMAVRNTSQSVMGFQIDRQTLSYLSAYTLGMNFLQISYYERINNLKIFRSPVWRKINFALLVVQFTGVFLGGGRGAFFLAIAIILVALAMNKRQLVRNSAYLLKTMVFIIVGGVALYYISGISVVQSGLARITSLFVSGQQDLSVSDRLDLYRDSINAFWDRPFFGHGIGSVSYVVGFYSHNLFGDVMVEGGLFLIIITVVLILLFFIRASRLVKMDFKAYAVVLYFLSSFIMLMFSGSILSDSAIWFSVVYVLYAFKIKRTAVAPAVKSDVM